MEISEMQGYLYIMCLWAGDEDLVFHHIVQSFMIWVDGENEVRIWSNLIQTV